MLTRYKDDGNFIRISRTGKPRESGSRLVVAWGGGNPGKGQREKWAVTINEYGVSFQGDIVMVTQIYEYILETNELYILNG